LKYGKYELIYGEKTNNLEKKHVRVRIFKKLIKSGAQNDLKGTLNYGLKNVKIWKICANLWKKIGDQVKKVRKSMDI